MAAAPVFGPPEHGPLVGVATTDGVCPACEAPGPVGSPCVTERCRRFACHRIPPGFVDRQRSLPDPLCGQLWGSYLLVRKLGEGGIGAVYLALQQPVGLRTALKVLHARRSTGIMAERFVSEAQALARLAHPNIVRLLGSGTAGDQAYLAMEYIDGGRTLADAMATGLDRGDALRILLQVVDALESAHRADVVHRDIKPANIMLQSTGREPYFVRIVDFGLAKFTDDGESTELAAGTPVYMAPEQLRRAGIGPWTDWYAVGVIACELLTGRRPFPPMRSHALMRLKVAGELDPLGELAGLGLPMPVQTMLARTLAFEPRERPRSADEVVALIEAAFAAMPGKGAPAPGERSATDAPPSATSNHYGAMLEPAAPTRARRRPWWLLVAALALALPVGWWLAPDPPRPTTASAGASPGLEHAAPDSPAEEPTGHGGAPSANAALSVPVDPDAALADAEADVAPDAAPPAHPRPEKSRRPAPNPVRRRLPPPRRSAPKPAPAPEAERLDIEVL